MREIEVNALATQWSVTPGMLLWSVDQGLLPEPRDDGETKFFDLDGIAVHQEETEHTALHRRLNMLSESKALGMSDGVRDWLIEECRTEIIQQFGWTPYFGDAMALLNSCILDGQA